MAIDFPNSPSVNQTYSVGNKVWKWNGSRWVIAGGVSQNAELADIDDVLISSVANGDFLRYNGSASAWINDPVNLSTDTVGDYVQSLVAGTGISLANNSGEGSTPTVSLNASLDNLSDVSASSPTDGHFLKYVSASSSWVPAAIPTINNLDDVGDVSAATPSSGDFLKWNGSAWVNDPINLGTDTTGNYISDISGGTGVTVNHTPGEGSTPTVSIGQSVGTSDSPTFAGLTINGASVSFEGSSADDYETTITVGNPTADRVITLPDATDTLIGKATTDTFTNKTFNTAGTGNNFSINNNQITSYVGSGQNVVLSTYPTITSLYTAGLTVDSTGVAFEGANADANQTSLVAAEPTADRIITLPNASGTVALSGSIALGTDTTGNYVSDVTAGTGVSVTHTPGEGSSPTISIGQAVGTSASVTFAQLTTTGDATIGGNLTVSGTTTTINTETINLADNIIVLNSNETSTPSQNAGIEIERGTSTNVVLRWNETTDKWQFTNDGTNYTDLGAGGATISSTAPSSPEAGALWFNSNTAQTFVYYDSSWVEVGGAAGGARVQVLASAPSSPLQGTMWFNSDTGGTYVYYGSTWIEIGAAPANAILQAIDAKGDLIVGTADNTVDNLTVGSNNQILMADSSTATGLKWATSPETDLVTTKGDLLVGTAADTLARQGVGANGSILMADSSQTNGITWYEQPLSNRNVIINGAMQVAQRGTSTTGKTGGGYATVDRFQAVISGLGTWTETVENDAPTGSGFRKSWKLTCTTANASPAAGNYMVAYQIVEGQNTQQFAKGTALAKQFALSFWVKGNTTGTYIVELYDNNNTRAVSASYTINTSDTWEKKTIIFPADTTGSLNNDNGNSLTVQWWLGAGTTFTSGSLATTWGAVTNANRAVGQTNLAGATSRAWQVTGVQLEAGAVATPFEFEDYGTTLAKCQRYYWKWVSKNSGDIYVSAYQPANTPFYLHVPMPVTMRTRPSSATISGTWSVINTSAAPSIFDRGDSWLVLQSSVNPGIGNTNQSGFNSNVGSSTLVQDAEL